MRRLIPTCGLILACATAGAAEEILVLTAGSLQRAIDRPRLDHVLHIRPRGGKVERGQESIWARNDRL